MVSNSNLSKEERAVLKQRAAIGDEAAMERLKAVRATEAEKSRRYLERQKLKKAMDDQRIVDQYESEVRVAIEQSICDNRSRMESELADIKFRLTPVTRNDNTQTSLTSTQTNRIPFVETSRLDSTQRSICEADATAQDESAFVSSFIIGTANNLKRQKRKIAEDEIKLRLEKAIRKKAKTALDRNLVEIKKRQWVNNEDAEADLKLELIRVRKALLEDEFASIST